MNDTTKPAAKAVAIAHKAPSRATIDTAQDELANLNYKLGRAQVAAMLSSGQAKADRAAVEELTALVEEKRQAVETMVETFTNPTRSDPSVALEAIREKLAPTTPRLVEATVVDSAGVVSELSIDLDQPIMVTAGTFHTRTGDRVGEMRNVQPGDTLTGDGSGKALDPIVATAAVVVDKIENAQPGDVEIPDTSTPEPIAPASNHGLHTGPTAPTFRPLLGDIWTDTSITPRLDRTWDGVRWVPAFPPAKPHKATRPPLDPVQGATWTYPRSSGDVEMYFDTVEGWQIIAEAGTEMAHDRRVVASDLSSDFWEKGELEHVLNAARPRKQLFGRG